jgi:RNA polymerase sigma-70 factor (family 1)
MTNDIACSRSAAYNPMKISVSFAPKRQGSIVQVTEQDIVEAIRSGDERVYETIFRQYYPLLCRYAYSVLQDYDESEEVVQAMFLNVWERRSGLQISTSLKAYLYQAVHNRCLNQIKHRQVRAVYQQHVELEPVPTALSPVQAVVADELSGRLQQAIAQLPEQCRRVFELSRFEELKYQEIADQLGISIKTVENQIGKALRILRTELADYLPLLLFLFL